MQDIVFYEAFDEEQKAIKKHLPDNIRAAYTPKTIQEAKEKITPARIISIRTQSYVPLSWVKNLDGILTRSQGYDHLLAFRQDAGSVVACGYLGGYCARAVAEHAILMMMALMRKLKQQIRQFRSFARDGLTGGECQGKQLLVIGVGNIGAEAVALAKGLNMAVRGVDIAPGLAGLDYVSLPRGLAWADAAICALPLTGQTVNMLDYAAFQSAKPGLTFINIARGEISPVKDLKRLLDEGILGGIGMDVYPQEGVLADSLRAGKDETAPETRDILKLAQDERVIFTPHNAFNTQEALERKAALTSAAIVSFLKERTFPHPVPLRYTHCFFETEALKY
jgi:D-lactate dehydrogenase